MRGPLPREAGSALDWSEVWPGSDAWPGSEDWPRSGDCSPKELPAHRARIVRHMPQLLHTGKEQYKCGSSFPRSCWHRMAAPLLHRLSIAAGHEDFSEHDPMSNTQKTSSAALQCPHWIQLSHHVARSSRVRWLMPLYTIWITLLLLHMSLDSAQCRLQT